MSLAPLNSLRVTSQTTLDDLKAFQEGIHKDDAKLRGTVNKDGSITLKAVDGDNSFLSRMFGVSKKRRDAARSALTLVMTNSGAIDRKPMGSLKSLINADRSHSPKSAMLRDLVAFAKADNADQFQKVSETPIKPETHEAHVMQRKFPTLEAKGLDTTRLENMLKLAGNFSRDQPLTEGRVKEFSASITKEILQQMPDLKTLGQNERTMLGVSDIEGYVKAAVARAVPLPHNEHVAEAMEKIAKGVADTLSEKLLGTTHLDDSTFKIGNEVFTKVETLGKGGHGTAKLYRSETTGREVVLKVPKDLNPDVHDVTIESTQFDFRSEIDMHTKVMDSGPRTDAKLVSFEGAVRLPNGQFATVTEACTGGEMFSVLGQLDDAVKTGSLTEDQAMTCKLTLMRDMAEGQQALFERGFSHRDVKFQNVFVTKSGEGKVADFGDTAFGRTFSLSNQKLIDNPFYLAPENVVARQKLEGFEQSVKEHQFAHLKAKVEVFNALVGPGGAFAHLGQDQLDATTLAPLGEGASRFAYNDRDYFGGQVLETLETRLSDLGDVGQILKGVINDLTTGEAQRLQSVIDDGKALLPAASLLNGAAADVWSFGSAILTSFIESGQSISFGGAWDKASARLAKYFDEKPTAPADGNGPARLPEPLEKGSFLTEKFASKHANGTVTGDPALDQLINTTLQRDPNARPSFADLLKNPIFGRPGVGDPSTRAVISALIGKPAKTAEDIKGLADTMPT